MKILISFIFLISVVNLKSQSPEYINKIEEFLILSGAIESVESSIDYIYDEYKKQLPSVPNSFWMEFNKKRRDDLKKMFVTKMAPVYYKYLTLEEIDFVIKFYKTEIGKKFAKLTNTLMEEGAKAGEEWGNYISEQINLELQKSGY